MNIYLLSWSKNFSEFCGNRNFITVFTKAHHCSLFWGRWIQSTPSHPK